MVDLCTIGPKYSNTYQATSPLGLLSWLRGRYREAGKDEDEEEVKEDEYEENDKDEAVEGKEHQIDYYCHKEKVYLEAIINDMHTTKVLLYVGMTRIDTVIKKI
jgi:hypothetical protein